MFKKTQAFPKQCGVYWMKDAKGKVLYVGKAKNLRRRVSAYFNLRTPRGLPRGIMSSEARGFIPRAEAPWRGEAAIPHFHSKVRGNVGRGEPLQRVPPSELKKEGKSRYQIGFLMRRTKGIEYCVTRNEQEALLLENKLIKQHKPRYNIELKDDKTYASLKLNIRHPFPGLFVTRHIVKDGSLYFGPFVSASPLKQTVDFLTKYFKLRTCSDSELANRSRPCLEYHIGRCSAPCVGKVSQENYAAQIEEAKLFLAGKKQKLLKILKEKMRMASKQMEYEEAARLRDLISAVRETLEGQKSARFEEKNYDPLGDRLFVNLQKRLQLVLKPAVIECVDISNFQGKEAVGSLVCFEEGRPRKDRYRRFKIRFLETPNDYAMMQEVLSRRFGRALRAKTPEEKQKWVFPDLLLVDGGKGQLQVAQKVLADLGLHHLPVAALAKAREGERADKVYIPGRKNPVSFAPKAKELLYLMRLRDEAHRFGLAYHRKLRAQKLVTEF